MGKHGEEGSSSLFSRQATQEEMREAKLPLGARDQCAHHLIPLNHCRSEEFYLPWKCQDERHTYERCEYYLFLQRLRKMEEFRKTQKAGGGLPATYAPAQ